MLKLSNPALVAFGLALLAGCGQTAKPPDTAADEAAIHASTAAWVEAYNSGDADKIVALYTDDAIMMPPDAPAAAGHEAMKQFLVADMATTKAAGASIALDTDASGVSGDLAWHSGTFHLNGAAGSSIGTAKYSEVWRKTNGKWLMIRDIWNNDAPPAAAAPPVPAKHAAAPKKKKKKK